MKRSIRLGNWLFVLSLVAVGVANSASGVTYDTTTVITSAVTSTDGVNVGVVNSNVTLTVDNGGSLGITAGSLNIGSGTAINEALAVNGTGILTMNAGSGKNINLNSGSGQSITVQGGGTMTLTGGGGTLYMGSTSALAPNTITVTGPGSTFTNGNATNGANIWFSGSNGQIIVSDGGVFTSLYRGIYVAGRWGGQTNSSLSVTGTGSVVRTNSTISLGDGAGGAGNNSTNMTLTISSGGKAYSASGRISSYAGANNNTATVTGTGSLWDLGNGILYLGNNATAQDNTLNVSNGGSLNNVASVLMNGTNNRFNLGSGGAELLSTATLNTVTLGSGGARLNIDNGRLIARTTGSLVSGTGQVDLFGAAYIDTAGFANSIDSVIAGTVVGTLIKQGGGTLTLTNALNTLGGDISVDAGTLSIGTTTAGLADLATVKIASGAWMDLNFLGTDTVNALYLNNVQVGAGIHDATTDSGYFTGTGQLNVLAPEPATMAFVLLGGVGLLARRRSRRA